MKKVNKPSFVIVNEIKNKLKHLFSLPCGVKPYKPEM